MPRTENWGNGERCNYNVEQFWKKEEEGGEKKKTNQQEKMLYIKFCCVEERAGCCSGKAGGRPAGPWPPWTTSLVPSLQTHVRSESEQRQLVEQGREEHEEAVKCC